MSKEEMLSEDELSIAAGGAHVTDPKDSARGATYITPTEEGEMLIITGKEPGGKVDGKPYKEIYTAERDRKGNLAFYDNREEAHYGVCVISTRQYKIISDEPLSDQCVRF